MKKLWMWSRKIVEHIHQKWNYSSLCWMHWDCELNVVIMFHMPSPPWLHLKSTNNFISLANNNILSAPFTALLSQPSRGIFTCGSNSFQPYKEYSWKRSDFMVDVHAIFFSSLILDIFCVCFHRCIVSGLASQFSPDLLLHQRLI